MCYEFFISSALFIASASILMVIASGVFSLKLSALLMYGCFTMWYFSLSRWLSRLSLKIIRIFPFSIPNFGFAEDAHVRHSSNEFDLCSHSIASFNFQFSIFNFQFSIFNSPKRLVISFLHGFDVIV